MRVLREHGAWFLASDWRAAERGGGEEGDGAAAVVRAAGGFHVWLRTLDATRGAEGEAAS